MSLTLTKLSPKQADFMNNGFGLLQAQKATNKSFGARMGVFTGQKRSIKQIVD